MVTLTWLADKVRSWLRKRECSDEYDDSHGWWEPRRDEYKCMHCGLVIGWPTDDQREQMGIKEDPRESARREMFNYIQEWDQRGRDR